MEHRALSVSAGVTVAAATFENISATYFQLGLAVRGAHREDWEGFTACVSKRSHPICNFATRLRLNPSSARKLQTLAANYPQFHVYRMETEDLNYQNQLLATVGFVQTYALHALAWRSEDVEEGDSLQWATSPMERSQVARFMTEQFFEDNDCDFRDTVVQTTTDCGFDLGFLEERGQIVAGVMASRSDFALGIYNLCVARHRRRRGLGARLVRSCQWIAWKEGRFATLHCDPGLLRWYSSFSFSPVGNIGVFSLIDENRVDIIDASSVLQRA